MSSYVYKASPIHNKLGDEFYDEVSAANFPKTILRYRNAEWSKRVGLGNLSDTDWLRHFGRFEALPENFPRPLALRYHGHQFQHYNPDLGDGRGFLFAQLLDPRGRVLDLGTKGSGTTPYSRRGDGRLTLKGGMREVLATEWLEALAVNTSKSFSLIETGENLERGDEPSPTRSSVLVRLSHSHIRFGSFQRLAYFENVEELKKLVRHSVKYYYGELDSSLPIEELTRLFFKEVYQNTAELCAQWMIAGFVHGVLNTDNMVITGESFDYGPYRFLPHFDPGFTAAYFDHNGLYAYGRQPEAVYWNLQQLAHALSFIFAKPDDELEVLLSALQKDFPHRLNQSMTGLYLKRLNLNSISKESDEKLLQKGFEFLNASRVSFDGFFFDWNGGLNSETFALGGLRKEFYQGEAFVEWRKLLSAYSISSEPKLEKLRRDFPEPESLLIDEIESIWSQIDRNDDWSAFYKKIEAFKTWGAWFKSE